MAKPEVVLALDSEALIAEVVRGGSKDAAANGLIRAVSLVTNTGIITTDQHDIRSLAGPGLHVIAL